VKRSRLLDRFRLDYRSHELASCEISYNTWHVRLVGPAWLTGGVAVNARGNMKEVIGRGHASPWAGVNLLLNYHVSWIHEEGAGELNNSTHKVASCEKCEREVRYRLSGFRKGRAPRLNNSTCEVTSSERC
jgi:hypothetical protein